MNGGAAGREGGAGGGCDLKYKNVSHCQSFGSHKMNGGASEDKYVSTVSQRTKTRTSGATARRTSLGESSKVKESLAGQKGEDALNNCWLSSTREVCANEVVS